MQMMIMSCKREMLEVVFSFDCQSVCVDRKTLIFQLTRCQDTNESPNEFQVSNNLWAVGACECPNIELKLTEGNFGK